MHPLSAIFQVPQTVPLNLSLERKSSYPKHNCKLILFVYTSNKLYYKISSDVHWATIKSEPNTCIRFINQDGCTLTLTFDINY